MIQELKPESLRAICEDSCLNFETTGDLRPLQTIIGQKRAVQALEFGLGIGNSGFNIFAAGAPGTGKTTAITAFLEEQAKIKEPPSDWCYVYNFADASQPRALRLPASQGKKLQQSMKKLVEEAKRDINRAFESDEYSQRRDDLLQESARERDALFTQLNERATEEAFSLQSTPNGIILIPLREGRQMSEEEMASLSSAERESMRENREHLEASLKQAINRVRSGEREVNERLHLMDQEIVRYAMDFLVQEIQEAYSSLPQVVDYLAEVERDIADNLDMFRAKPEESQAPPMFPPQANREHTNRRYEVNVVVDNSNLNGAPVVLEFNPSYQNLFGRVEKEAQFGALQTDFTMIRPGSLHRANGGFLILQVEDVLRSPYSWDGLKRCLKEHKIIIEDMAERMGYVNSKALNPEPIPLNVKTILIGSPMLYHTLYSNDSDFVDLFKVKADFDSRMERSEDNIRDYAAFVCTLCNKDGLLHMDKDGVAKIVEHSSRLADDKTKLSTQFAEISDVIREANYWATKDGAPCVGSKHVAKAIDEKIHRSDLVRERIGEMIHRGMISISTEGEAVGQINGLAVVGMGGFSFGRPGRITVSLSAGREGLMDIEREARLGGSLHSKGVMILGGYLADKFAQNIPLSLAARLTFEQSYDEVDGDSASSTELYALLSRLADLPLKQGIAVTGSVNQRGEVQAIGGVNEKIEGFFYVCQAKGLTGQQGVMIPATNVQNLMLREEVVEAVNQGQFHVYPVTTIDDGIELLTGVKAGVQLESGAFEEGSVSQRVEQRLRDMATGMRDFMRSPSEEGHSNGGEKKTEEEEASQEQPPKPT